MFGRIALPLSSCFGSDLDWSKPCSGCNDWSKPRWGPAPSSYDEVEFVSVLKGGLAKFLIVTGSASRCLVYESRTRVAHVGSRTRVRPPQQLPETHCLHFVFRFPTPFLGLRHARVPQEFPNRQYALWGCHTCCPECIGSTHSATCSEGMHFYIRCTQQPSNDIRHARRFSSRWQCLIVPAIAARCGNA